MKSLLQPAEVSIGFVALKSLRVCDIVDRGQAFDFAAVFRGDPNQIIIAGGSAGGCSVFQTIYDMMITKSPRLSNVKGLLSIFGFAGPFDYTGPFSEYFVSHKENGEGVPMISHDILVNMWSDDFQGTS
jgi:hypothetical protein